MEARLFSDGEIGARLAQVYTFLINLAKKREQNANIEEVCECEPKTRHLSETKWLAPTSP